MKLVFIFIVANILTACASLDALVAPVDEMSSPSIMGQQQLQRFSAQPNVAVPLDRQYRKMNRSRLEEESELGSQAGSMWSMDGQSAYLFAQNITRKEGDVLSVQLDGPAMKQVETKVSVIKKLIKQLEEQEQMEMNMRNPANSDDQAQSKPKESEKKEDDKQNLDEIKNVAARIVERMPDGNYRIKGAQPFMIGKREYKVIVTGMIRPEDYNDQGVNSQKLLDPQYDVVSIRRSSQNE